MDRMTKKQRSACMSHVANKNTELEVIFRKHTWALKMRGYRLHTKLPGKPDMYFPRQHVAVFVDGCFWHGCRKCNENPSTNKKFWSAKKYKNIERDKIVNKELNKMGILIVRFWGHQVEKTPRQCAEKLQNILQNLNTKADV